jgi:SAM-dependent methyltransferase
VLCECALCAFPDKPAAVREIVRLLRPDGVLALSDMTAEPDRLPIELRSLDASIACIGDARRERHDAAMRELIDHVDARLRVARALRSVTPATLADSIDRSLAITAAAQDAVADGALGYGVLIARRS